MKRILLLVVLLFSVHTIVLAQNNYDGVEVMFGAGGGTDGTAWVLAGVNYTAPIGDCLRFGGGVEYNISGNNDIYGGDDTLLRGVTFFADFRGCIALSKVTYFTGVLECGPFVGEGLHGDDKLGVNINPQCGFSFRLSQSVGLVLNTRVFYKNVTNSKSNVFGLMLGLGF